MHTLSSTETIDDDQFSKLHSILNRFSRKCCFYRRSLLDVCQTQSMNIGCNSMWWTNKSNVVWHFCSSSIFLNLFFISIRVGMFLFDLFDWNEFGHLDWLCDKYFHFYFSSFSLSLFLPSLAWLERERVSNSIRNRQHQSGMKITLKKRRQKGSKKTNEKL